MLREYKKKRDFKKTPEPAGKKTASPGRAQSLPRFVVQKHAARRLHYDFRLELDGVLLSWAVPKGIPLDPSEKHMAIRTEDHPLEYRKFEGIIPAPGYGAGEVIIWDEGVYYPTEHDQPQWTSRSAAEKQLRRALSEGKISFFLKGKKLQGSWSLVRMKRKETDWLLIKHNDSFANKPLDSATAEQSVVTGRTLDDIKHHKGKSATRKTSPATLASPAKGTKRKFPGFEPPMLASLADSPFGRKGWFFEPKLDGIRGLAYIKDGKVDLCSRRGLSLTYQYPTLAKELSTCSENCVIDGEIVAFDEKGRPSFQKLQARSGLTKAAEIKFADLNIPVTYYVFDILYLGNMDLRGLPLSERKAVLQKLIIQTKQVRLVENLGEDGEAALKACLEHGLEGVMGKDSSSRYESGRRSRSWLKVKGTQTEEFLICGYTQGLGARQSSFGSLMLGEHDSSGSLKYVGNVGTGFDSKKLAHLMSLMKPLATKTCPFKTRPPGLSNPVWLEPKLVAETKFAERTKDGILRAPVFMHLREDISPEEVKPKPIVHVSDSSKAKSNKQVDHRSSDPERLPSGRSGSKTSDSLNSKLEAIIAALDNSREKLVLEIDGVNLDLSNLNKEFWPAYKKQHPVTKRDYIRYLAQVAPYLLPHLHNRMLTLIRFPNGIKGQKFYQKHWDDKLPAFVETVRAYTEHEDQDQNFLLCNNLPTLIWLGQIADLELHTSHTRISPEPDAYDIPKTFTGSVKAIENSLLNYPDYIVFDLDPYLYSGKELKGDEPQLNRKGFRETCKVALWVKELLDQLSLNAYVKTSGKTGLHIYLPIARKVAYDQVRHLSEAVGRAVLEAHPDEVTMEWSVAKRTGKVFFDHNMNARSKSLASIYSPRVIDWASVSTPVDWEELSDIYPTDFNIETLSKRLNKLGDLWSDILEKKNDLQKLLASDKPKSKTKLKK